MFKKNTETEKKKRKMTEKGSERLREIEGDRNKMRERGRERETRETEW